MMTRMKTPKLFALLATGSLLLAFASPASAASRGNAGLDYAVGFRPRPNRAVLNKPFNERRRGGGGDVDTYGAAAATPALTESPPASAAAAAALAVRGGGGDVPSASELSGALFFTALVVAVSKIFAATGVAFPAMLACTCLVFASLVLTEAISPGSGDAAFELLTPGAGLLTKWIPVMFVPGLAMMPLAPSIGSPLEVVKVLSVVVVGFFFTMATTAYTVLAMRTAQGLVDEELQEPATPQTAAANVKGWLAAAKTTTTTTTTTSEPPVAPAAKPFSAQTLDFLQKGTVLSAAISIAATRTDNPLSSPLRTVFMGFATVMTYVWGARLPSGLTKVVHPLVISTAGTLLITQLNAVATGSTFKDVLRTYKAGSLAPMSAGAGDILLFLLGPAVGCFSVAMYSRKGIVAENLLVVFAAMLVSSAGGLFGTALYARLLGIGSDMVVRLSLIPRNVTVALAMVITNILGGNIAITASVVVLTGIFGATVGRTFLDALGIKDPVSRGLGMGASGQSLGVASMSSEKEAFPFAAINLVLTAVSATTLASIPAVRKALVHIATGGAK